MTSNRPRALDRPIRTAADLHRLWSDLMGAGGFGRRTLWIVFLDADGRPAPTIVPIDDVPVAVAPRQVDGLRTLLDHFVGSDGIASAALLLSRPGGGEVTQHDRVWGRMLAPLSRWPIHLATADRVRPFAPDDLLQDRNSAPGHKVE